MKNAGIDSIARSLHLNEDNYNTADGNPFKIDSFLEKIFTEKTAIKESLTRRETQILRSIVAGNSNKKIAMELSRSQRTIEYHRNRLMRKLKVHSAAELVKLAIETGFA